MKNKSFEHVSNLWNDAEAAKLTGVERLVYRSNKLGADQRITNTGGGNTSSKLIEIDPLTGEKVEVLWVKGSGGDLRTSTKRKFFVALPEPNCSALQKSYATRKDKGLKSQAEDDMVGHIYAHDVQPESARPVPLTRRCTVSFRRSSWITCTRTRSSPSRRRQELRRN